MAEKKSRKGIGGRPPITTKDLPEDWKEIMISLAKEGASVLEISTHLGIPRQRMYDLRDREPEFHDIFVRARALCQSWWEEQGRVNMKDRDFNNALWAFNMKNRFRDDWGDKQVIEQDIKVSGAPQISFGDTTKKD
jgi:hypothetical protein